jgi:hypothetical protein
LGWVEGFEPSTAGATVRSSTTELHPPQIFDYSIRRRSGFPGQHPTCAQECPKIGLVGLVHGTIAAVVRTAGGLPATSRGRRASVTVGRKGGQLLLQLRGVTLGALGLLSAQYDGLKLVAALSAQIFENRHDSSPMTGPVQRHRLACHNDRSRLTLTPL